VAPRTTLVPSTAQNVNRLSQMNACGDRTDIQPELNPNHASSGFLIFVVQLFIHLLCKCWKVLIHITYILLGKEYVCVIRLHDSIESEALLAQVSSVL